MILPRKITRQTGATVFDTGRRRAVCVTVDPPAGLVTFRLKGTRRAYALPADWLYKEACQRHVARERQKRMAERRRRRGAP